MEIPKIPIALLNTEQSSLFSDVVDWRIVGGNAVTVLRKYTWAVSLRHNNRHYCGAMLIHPRWVISAKHCFRITKTPDIWIGGLNFEQEGDFIKRKAEQIIEHPDLDVALIRLDKDVTERPPIKVNNNPNIPVGIQTDAIGWGRLAEGGANTSILQEVTLPIVDGQKCVDLYGAGKFTKDKMLCAGVDTGGKDACQGDSGGPLIINWNDKDPNTQYLVGVTSWGIGCARAGKMGVWINIAVILPWILRFIPDLMAYDAISMASKSVPPSGPLPLTNPPKTIVEKFTPEERELTCFETQIYIYLVIILTILFMIYILKKYRYI
jgi:trypsin